MGDDAQPSALAGNTIAQHKHVDILHSHVGVQVNGSAGQVDPGGMDRSRDLDLRAHLMAARLVIPYMKSSGGGSIVITSSNSGAQLDRVGYRES